MLQPISDQTAGVGVELSIELRATDADGDSLSFDFAAPAIADIKTRAQLSSFADNVAIFRWTPQVGDRNTEPYAFDFKVTDGHTTTTETVQITVGDSIGGSAPVFRQPLGTGTTLDLANETCIDVNIVIEDTDSTMVTISEQDPKIAGAELTQNDAFTATWHWCPAQAQIAAQDRYLLQLLADDGTNQTAKSYLIVLRIPPGMNCPGETPTIDHTPLTAQTTVSDLQVAADISDDLGVKSVLLYWSTAMPKDPPDIASMNPVAMKLTAGDGVGGTWEASIPNPVAGQPAGTKKTVYYLIEAKDNDDPVGTCDHVADSPDKGTYAVDVTAPSGMTRGTSVGCDSCTKDIQCAAGYECIQIGTMGTFCARECSGNPPCDSMYSCSSGSLTSVDGKMSRFCRPSSMTCPPQLVCNDDSFEPNDTFNGITDPKSLNLTPSPVPYANLVICPINGGASGDEDWYQLSLPDATNLINAQIVIKDYTTGVPHSDLDLEINDSTGTFIDYSERTSNTENAAVCLPSSAQKAFIHVYPYSGASVVASKYDLTYTRVGPDSGEAMGDDNHETNNLLGPTGSSVTQNVCGSEDWFWTILTERQRLAVDLKFTQKAYNPQQDGLTLKVMRDNCTSGASPMPVASGAPLDGGLRVDYNSPDGGGDCYYVVVGAQDPSGGNVYQINSVSAP